MLNRFTSGFILVLLALFAAAIVFAQNEQEAPPQPTPEQLEAMAERAAQLGLPEGTIQLSPCEPGMGEHWARLEDMPLGPIYGVVGDEVVFVELMPSQEAFANGESWTDVLKPLEGYSIDHVDIEFQENGHEGYAVPHYDIHAYFESHATHLAYCPR